ncbi:MAG: hypothetical protein A2Y62_14555 [Candidatus Fischerbacteria bacterium RBG_13_37_8]|uniref:Uncharacterized protein n=1 Tax=Candidatus Fischerbacteria bacterium RBG_13_37_8 TaxID=1817863 RepID=A0A1F5V5A9_9BACT|nr:MAG: hypothetical protein A2Y62_14555 [Candidatus Fischerbacteria bacterium RBG_13_37_8]
MWLSIDLEAGKLAGEYLNKYQKSKGVTLTDSIIAACAKIHGLKLWTANKKHYPMLNKEDFLEEK